MSKALKAPFPYFGGKSRIAGRVWELLGDCKRYMEPFFGSGAVLLARPDWKTGMDEIVCDADGHIANVWRSIAFAPDEVFRWCDWPVNHADLIARRKVLRDCDELLKKLCGDPEYYDAKLAGYWIWGASCWIGAGFTRKTQIPELTCHRGVHTIQCNSAISEQRPKIHKVKGALSCMNALSERLRWVKVVCGDWSRICGGNWQGDKSPCGIFLDPPYSDAKRDRNLYSVDSMTVAIEAREWALKRGGDPRYRIVLAGYEGEHNILLENGWRAERWKASGGYAKTQKAKDNAGREILFISPHCVDDIQGDLF